MEIIVKKNVLNEGLRKVSRAINSSPTIPILSGVLVSVNEDELVLTGSDTTLSIRTTISNNEKDEVLEVTKSGDIVLPAREFTSICRAMPKDDIKISVQDNLQVKLSSGKSNFTLNGVDGEDYPRLPKVDENGKGIAMNGNELGDFIEKTVYAVSKMESRPILTGVNFFFQNDQLGLVATDSFRLSRVVGGDFEGEGFDTPAVIPERALKEIPRILKDSNNVTMIKENNQVVLKTENDYILTRLMEGSYPETDRLIPKNYTTLLKVNRIDFLSAMERSAILGDKDTNTVTFKIDDENEGIFETIELSHKDDELGQSKEDILVEGIEGEAITVSFNPIFMIDALKRINENEVHIEFNGAMRPFVVKGVGDNSFIQLITPVRRY